MCDIRTDTCLESVKVLKRTRKNKSRHFTANVRKDFLEKSDRASTVGVVATLALGIGVNAAIFSVFNLLLRPLPVKEPESIVRFTLEERGPGRGPVFISALRLRS